MSSLDDIPFDLNGSESDSQDRVDDIFAEMGYTRWADVFVQWETADVHDLRGVRYATPEEGLFDMYDRGLIGFTQLVYYPDDDMYSLVVNYPE